MHLLVERGVRKSISDRSLLSPSAARIVTGLIDYTSQQNRGIKPAFSSRSASANANACRKRLALNRKARLRVSNIGDCYLSAQDPDLKPCDMPNLPPERIHDLQTRTDQCMFAKVIDQLNVRARVSASASLS